MNDPNKFGFRSNREPDQPSSDWPVAISMVALLASICFIVWVFAR